MYFQFNSISTSYSHLSTFFIVLLIVLNHCSTSATKLDYQNPPNFYESALYDDIDDNTGSLIVSPKSLFIADSHERLAHNPWARIFHRYQDHSLFPSYRRYDGRTSVSLGRRSIPIELQKALFAHGIVGRRR